MGLSIIFKASGPLKKHVDFVFCRLTKNAVKNRLKIVKLSLNLDKNRLKINLKKTDDWKSPLTNNWKNIQFEAKKRMIDTKENILNDFRIKYMKNNLQNNENKLLL